MADMKFVVDYSDIQTMRRELVGVSKDAKQSASVFETAYNKAERQLQRTAKANQQFYNETLKIDKATKSASQSASVFAQELRKQEKATEAYTKETRRLQLQYNTTFRAADSFKRQLRELNEAHSRSAISTERHEQQVMELKNEYREFLRTGGGAMNQFGQIASKSTRQFKRFGAVGMQQVGYQVGDFAVQLQGGTNAAVALGQQGSQLLGIFGPLGAVMGAALAIVTAFAAPMLDMAKSADEAAKKMEDFEEKLKSARSTVKGMTDDLRLLKSGFEDAFEVALVDNIEVAEKKLRDAQAEYRELIRLAEEQIAISGLSGSGVTPEDIVGESRVRAAEKAIEAAEEELRIARETRDELEFANSAHEARNNFIEARNRALEKGVQKEREVLQALVDYGIEMAAVLNKSKNLKDEIGEAAYNALQIAGVDMQSPIDKATKAAAQLAVKLGVSLERLNEMRNMTAAEAASGGFIGSRLGPGQRPDDPGASRGASSMEIPSGSLLKKPETSGSGGSSVTTPKEDPRAFLKSLQRELDLKRLLVGVNEAQAERLKIEARLKEELLETGGKVTEADRERIAALVKQSEAIRKAEEAEERRRANIERFENQMSDSITNVVKEAQSIEDAFIGVIRNIVEELFRQNVAKPIASGIGSFVSGLFGATPNANGNAFSGGRVTAFADGGVVSKPTIFPMANGAGLMGEAGPEAIMPLKRGKGGKLGVAAEGGSSGSVTVNNHFHIAANGDDSVRRIIQSEAPKISAMTEKQIINSRRRGGSLKQAFG